MTLATASIKAPSTVSTTKAGPPEWMTLESALQCISDHYEWDPKSTTNPRFAVLNQEPQGIPIRTEKPFIWGSYKTVGERTVDDKIKLTITRVVEAGKPGNSKTVPFKIADLAILSNKRFILVDHRTGVSTKPRKFSQQSLRTADITFDLKNDFVVQKDKARPETKERLEIVPWVNNCYTLVQIK